MRKILFSVKSPQRYTGGLIKMRDYFDHCLHHKRLQPDIHFYETGPEAAAAWRREGVWAGIPEASIVLEPDTGTYDAFVAGRRRIPKEHRRGKYISILQTLWARREVRGLKRSSHRICVSQELHDAYAPLMHKGTATVIPIGIPLDVFRPGSERRAGSVLILATKNPSLGQRLQAALEENGRDVALLIDYLSRAQFAKRLAQRDIFVGLPFEHESFYLPAVEAMACGAAVVCADAVGNRSFCIHDETCAMPAAGDFSSHMTLIERMLEDDGRRERLRRAGLERAQSYSLADERRRFYRFLEEVVFRAALE